VPQGELNFTIFVTDGIDTISAVASIDVEGQVTISEFLNIQINVYPNPTTDFVTVDGCEFELIQVYNTAGTLIIETNEATINFSDLPVGGYVLRILNGDNIAVTKVVVKQ
jgi:hypothetical protein